MKAISVSGSRKGMNDEQFMNLERVVLWDLRGFFMEDVQLHHGDCMGVDEAVHNLFASMKKDPSSHITIFAHPGHDRDGKSPWRAYCEADVVLPSRPYAVRNQDMVLVGDVEIIIPDSGKPKGVGSGTWMSYSMARREQRKRMENAYFIYVLWPNGVTERLNYTSIPDWEYQ